MCVIVSALMRRAVPVSEDDAGFADDPADDGAGVAFLAALPLDEDGAALGGEGQAGLAEAFEELFRLPAEFGVEGFRFQGGGGDAQVREVVPEAFGDVHVLAVPSEVEAFDKIGTRVESVRLWLAFVEKMQVLALGVCDLLDVGLRRFEEFHLKHDASIRIRAAEFHHVGIDGFIPFPFRRMIRRLGDDRERGERGEGEEGAAFHGGGGGSARRSLGDAGQDGWEMSDCRNANENAGGGKGKVRSEWEVPSGK